MATATQRAPRAIYDPEGVEVKLGARTYQLREVPIARVKRFRNDLLSFFDAVNASFAGGEDGGSEGLRAVVDAALEQPLALLRIVIPELDHDPDAQRAFEDEEEGATIPQVLHALDQAISINGLDFVRKAVPFALSLIRVSLLRLAAGQAMAPPSSTRTDSSGA